MSDSQNYTVLNQSLLTHFRILDSLLKRLEFVAVLYYRKGEDDDALDEALSGLMAIKEEAMLNDIYFVLVSDQREFAKLGGNSIGKFLTLVLA